MSAYGVISQCRSKPTRAHSQAKGVPRYIIFLPSFAFLSYHNHRRFASSITYLFQFKCFSARYFTVTMIESVDKWEDELTLL